MTLAKVLAEVARERQWQDRKWGEQNHPNGTGPGLVWAYTGPAEYVAEVARAECDRLHGEGVGTWQHILTKEVAEAYACGDPQGLRAELVQVAAVVVAWIEAIDRRVAHEWVDEATGVEGDPRTVLREPEGGDQT